MGDPLVGAPLTSPDEPGPSARPPVTAPEGESSAPNGSGGDFAAPRLLPPPSSAGANTETDAVADSEDTRRLAALDAVRTDERRTDAAGAGTTTGRAATAADDTAYGTATDDLAHGIATATDADLSVTTSTTGLRADDTAALDAAVVAEVIDATAPPLVEPGIEAPVLPYPDIAPDPSFIPTPGPTTAGPSPTDPIIVARRTRRDPARRERIAPVLRRRRRPRIRRVNRVVRRVDAWTVFKISAIFYFVAYIILLVAGVLLWNLAYTTGTVGNVEGFVRDLFGLKTFTFNGEEIFRASWVLGLFLAIAGTGLNVTLCVLFNLIADLVGGVRVTVLEEEVVLHERPRVFARTDAPLPAPVPEGPTEQPVDAVAGPSDNVDGLPAPGL
jgi:hypothetical protein